MQTVFAAVLGLCREAGLVQLDLVALDGTKVAANASLEANAHAKLASITQAHDLDGRF